MTESTDRDSPDAARAEADAEKESAEQKRIADLLAKHRRRAGKELVDGRIVPIEPQTE